jgi:hypothetical protein
MPYWFDGNNLIGLSAAAARRDRRVRTEFMATLSGWRKAGGGRMLVWFDGDDPCDVTPPPGVAVRYSAPESADAAICRSLRATERPGEVIVVTGDRELAARCRHAGAAVLDWGQFSARMRTRDVAMPRPSGTARRFAPKPAGKSDAPPVDVEDWLRFFGLDEPKQ